MQPSQKVYRHVFQEPVVMQFNSAENENTHAASSRYVTEVLADSSRTLHSVGSKPLAAAAFDMFDFTWIQC